MNPGTRLGPYEIVSRIGAGGMGEVWRANDTRLGRSVAVKILPAEFASNAQLRTRFEREARTISLLNHPHICTLFDVGDDYLVMELLEGETLADRLGKGPLPIAEVLRYGTQIADALDKAHRQGVVHRDLKPANVMTTRGGAKLLDFGLAKSGAVEVNLEGATEHRPLTQEGTILGTFQYMSPEQLEGQEVDSRTDIFALGTLLYEMATGRRAFDGKTKTSLIAAIVTAEPQPLSQVQPLAPPALEHVIRKCLAKDREERWQSAHDIAEELRWISEAGSQAGVTSAAAASRRLRRSTIIAAAIVGWILAIAAGVAVWSLRGRVDVAETPIHSEIAPPDGTRIGVILQGSAVVSPDGHLFVFPGSVSGGPQQLFVRDLSSGSTRAIDGTIGGAFPFWSPDSASLGFFADGKLKVVQVNGGGVQDLANAPAGRGGSWSSNGTILFAPDINTGLMRVSVGGAPAAATRVPGERVSHRNPCFLADGEHFLYTVRDDTMSAADLHAGSLSGNLDKLVIRKASNVAVSGGHLLFLRSGNLLAQPFDEKELAVKGSPVVIAENLEYVNARDRANFTASNTGLLIYRGNVSRTAQPTWFAADGKLIGPVGPPGIYRFANVSPDGRKVVFAKNDGSGTEDLWVMDTERGTTTRVTFVSAGLMFGAISPDGTLLAVSASFAGGLPTVWTQAISGTAERRDLYRGEETFQIYAWSPDSRSLYGTTQRNQTGFDIAVIDANSGKYHYLLNAPYDEQTPAVSPDGKWLAYMSNESGRAQIYVTSLPDARMKWQVSQDGGGGPVWSKDGNEIYFGTSGAIFSVSGALYSVRVMHTRDGLDFDAPRKLPIDLENAVARGIAPDGRVLLVQGKPNTTPFHMITNWTRTLQK